MQQSLPFQEDANPAGAGPHSAHRGFTQPGLGQLCNHLLQRGQVLLLLGIEMLDNEYWWQRGGGGGGDTLLMETSMSLLSTYVNPGAQTASESVGWRLGTYRPRSPRRAAGPGCVVG